ncbi:MAG: hypothetical protein ACOY82_05650 [Pseudomonadota bacterium]
MPRKLVLVLAIAAAAASVAAYAQKGLFVRNDAVRGVSADLKNYPEQRLLSRRASQASAPVTAKRAPIPTKLAAPIYDVTVDDVYDVDSFGRYVKWLGLTSAFIDVQTGCAKPTTPDEYCQEMNPTVGAITAFNFQDAARIKLPKYASNSLLCYWFSPLLRVTWQNPTAAPVVGRFYYSPTLTIENPVLDDPALIDPTTGAPFGGKLLTSMTSSERFQESLNAGITLSEQTRDSTVCMAGFLSHKSLIENYGLTPAQADDFFASPTTIRLNVSGSVQYVGEAHMVFGLRVVGD